jgi:hypothetical protein
MPPTGKPVPPSRWIIHEPSDSGVYLRRRAATPDELRRLLDLERSLAAGELSREEFDEARDALLAAR